MTMDFAAAMHAATQLTRAQRLMEATHVIQRALLLSREEVPSEPSSKSAAKGRAIENLVIDLTPNVTEREVTAPHDEKSDAKGSRPQRRTRACAAGSLEGFVGTLREPKLPILSLDTFAGLKARKAFDIPDGAQFLNRSFACAAGSRAYKLYIPHRHLTGRRPLLVMLHGGTQDADDFAAGTKMNVLAEEYGLIVAYPSQSKSANPSLCWNWFKPEHQRRGGGEPSIIAGLTNEIIAAYDVDPKRVFVAGLSAGGAMAAVMGATYPEIYAAVGVHSGLPYRSAADIASAFAAMRGDPELKRRLKPRPGGADNAPRIRTIVFHGDADQIVHPSNAAKTIEAQAKVGDSMESRTASASRGYTRTVSRDKTGLTVGEEWLIHGGGHAWSGGSPDGTYTDASGPDASREMLRFFFELSNSPRGE